MAVNFIGSVVALRCSVAAEGGRYALAIDTAPLVAGATYDKQRKHGRRWCNPR